MNKFPAKLRRARKARALSQAECATLLGVSFEAISKWERGLTEPATITQEGALARLAKPTRKK